MASTVSQVAGLAAGFDPSTWKNAYYPWYVTQARRREPSVLLLDGVFDSRNSAFLFGCDRRGLPRRTEHVGTPVHLGDGQVIPVEKLRKGHLVEIAGRDVYVEGIDVEGDRVHVYLHQPACEGTGPDALSWVFLERGPALHALYRHYAFPNLSICRYRSRARGDYAADLVFEIDAHADIPNHCDLDFFHPYIAAAVEVGRRVYDHMITVLGVEEKYITTAISRMGARVTVDWRAFGPRRLVEIFTVIKYTSAQVFGAEGLGDVARRYNIPKLVIDTGPYEQSDLPRPSEELGNRFIGPWLRPLGAVHTKSSNMTWWYRTTAVPHRLFSPDAVEHLIRLSRARGGPPDLNRRDLHWPESRLPSLDRLIEEDPRPARPLIALFEDDNLVEQLDLKSKAVVEKLHRVGARPRAAEGTTARQHLRDEDVRRVLDALGADYRDGGDCYRFDCILPTCKRGGEKASLHKESGAYWCWRDGCRRGVPLRSLAVELGVGHLLPASAQSSEPLQWVDRDRVSLRPPHQAWQRTGVTVLAPVCSSVEQVREERQKALEAWYANPGQRLFIDLSPTGLGKSFSAQQLLRTLGVRYRVFGPRDDVKRDYADRLPGAVVIEGRRPAVNCTSRSLDLVAGRVEPIGETLCSVCPDRAGCTYQRDLKAASRSDTILAHPHGSFASYSTLDNGSEVDVVDEDALDAIIHNVELDAEELGLFRALAEMSFRFDDVATNAALLRDVLDLPQFDAEGDVGLEVEQLPLSRRAATPGISALLSALETALQQDHFIESNIELARSGRAADLALARVLFRHPPLRHALDALTEQDIVAHEAARAALVSDWQAMQRPMGYLLSRNVEATWATCPERAEVRRQAEAAQEDPDLAEIGAFVAWSQARLEPLPWPSSLITQIERPKAVFRQLVDALRHLYTLYVRGEDEPTRLLARRSTGAGPWVLQLSLPRTFLADSKKILYLSATTTPVRTELLFGTPLTHEWVVFAPQLPRTDHRMVIADHSYSGQSFKDEKLRQRVFETVLKLIERENERTGLPVALLGPSKILMAFLTSVFGKKAEAVKLSAQMSEEAKAELRSLTLSNGFVVGWAYGVAGSNAFFVEEDGRQRFLRAAVILGNPIPNLVEFSDRYRGLLAGYTRLRMGEVEDIGPWLETEPVVPDWRLTYRALPFVGHDRGDKVLTATNMIGFGDPVTNEIVDGRYLAEIVQMAGRIRPYLSDPIDPAIEARTYVFAGVAIPGWEVDRIAALDDLRGELGLSVEPQKARHRVSKMSLADQLKERRKKRGLVQTIRWLVEGLLKQGRDPGSITTAVRVLFEETFGEFRIPEGEKGATRVTNELIADALAAQGREDEAKAFRERIGR